MFWEIGFLGPIFLAPVLPRTPCKKPQYVPFRKDARDKPRTLRTSSSTCDDNDLENFKY